jgi:hypothetical protein
VGADPEAAYYQAIEEFFVSRRGDPLFLSSADWLLIRKWRTGGIPLRVVLRGVADALDSHAHSWSRERKVGSLAYCAREVEVAHERWRRSLGFGAESGMDVASVLRGFAEDLGRARGLGAESARMADELAGELRRRSGEERLEDLDGWLEERERALVAALGRDLGPEAVARVEAAVEETLAPYRARMPERVLEQIRRESLTRRLLATHGIPRLSLFHAAGGP